MTDKRTSTGRRSGATEHSSDNGNISDNVWLAVARHSCGATDGGVKRLPPFEALHTPTVSNGSLSRATICDTTNMFAEKHPHISAAPCSPLAF